MSDMSDFEQWLKTNYPDHPPPLSEIWNAAKQSMQGKANFDLSACLNAVADMGFWPQVIYDDNGNWAIWDEGSSNMRLDDDMDYHCSFLIPAEYFKPSLHDAWSSYVEKLKQLGNDVSELYTHAPDLAARIAELEAEIARLTKELEEARKDAEAVAWYRETAGGIAICYVQNEPPKDADGPWHPLFTSARKTWIPMNEQRPIEEHGNKVLGFSDGYIFDCEYEYSDGEGHWCNITGETMTHWMPRPPEPDASLNIKGGAV